MALKRNKNLKLFYSIGEVAEIVGVTESTLRFWEKEFPNLKPQKAGRGIRQYSQSDIEEVKKVYHLLKERGLKLEGARQALKSPTTENDVRLDVLERLKFVSAELQDLSRALNNFEA